ncbi:MAG: nicotinate-nucleotide adenylyltransferase, partial [Syntrophaceae bacterium]|nr:nicotinate-nucleotide adenylyltransferase [Syntrophaceae bacterium]
MKWGLFGGTFDPIHIGHLRCAEEIREMFDLDRIIFIPAARPPHKTDVPITDFTHRERMIHLAIAGNLYFECSDLEQRRPGKSFSVETVTYFLETYPQEVDIYFIVGQDAFQAIQTWREWERLLGLCNFIVMTRPGYEQKDLHGILPASLAESFRYDAVQRSFQGSSGHAIYLREVTLLNVSSSGIRERTGRGESINYLVPETVKQYLQENR